MLHWVVHGLAHSADERKWCGRDAVAHFHRRVFGVLATDKEEGRCLIYSKHLMF